MKKLLAISAGHGGIDPGAQYGGYIEKELNLIVARRVHYLLLEKGYDKDQIELIRKSDYTLVPNERTTIIKDNFTFCIDIHFNKFDGSAGGVETIHSMYGETGKKLADILAESINEYISLPVRRVFDREGSHGDYYYMHRNTGSTITVIVEGMFIDNELNLDYLNIEKLSEAIANGFNKFYKENFKKEDDKPMVELNNVSLKKGDKGEEVKKLQITLNNLGYDTGKPDGIFGTKTFKAIMAFQRLNNLVVDGIVGKNTYSKITDIKSKGLNIGYRTMYQFDSMVNVFNTDPDKHIVDVELGIFNKLETLSSMVKKKLSEGKKVVAAVNCQFFGGGQDGLGTLVDEGLYYYKPDDKFIDFIYYKDGTSEIKNIDSLKEVARLQSITNFVIGTSWSLMKNGAIALENLKIDHHRWDNPRTLLGHRKDGSFVLVCVDGRSLISKGVTSTESAEIMKYLNSYNAVNFDGGGSTEMILVKDGKIDIVNNPSDGRERHIGTAIFVYEK